jgi:hypothetical protein
LVTSNAQQIIVARNRWQMNLAMLEELVSKMETREEKKYPEQIFLVLEFHLLIWAIWNRQVQPSRCIQI